MDDPNRFLTNEMIEQVILRGVDYDYQFDQSQFRRKHEFDNGIRGVLVLSTKRPLVITGWTEVASFTQALANGWDQESLEKIQAFEDSAYEHT